MNSLPFNGIAALYEETRVFNQRCFNAAVDFLTGEFPPSIFRNVFEPGIGTGRIAIPLAKRGYAITGVDISQDMLAHLQKRLTQATEHLRISHGKADATNLPFQDASFDMAIVVHLFYFIHNWKRAVDELLRVVKRSGPVVLMHTGTGAEIPFLNDRYKELSAEQGFPIEEIGVKSTSEVVDYVRSLGCYTETVRDRWQWTSRLRLDKAMGYLRSRAYSFTTTVPKDIHLKVMEKLEAEMQYRFSCSSEKIEIPNQIYLVQISRK